MYGTIDTTDVTTDWLTGEKINMKPATHAELRAVLSQKRDRLQRKYRQMVNEQFIHHLGDPDWGSAARKDILDAIETIDQGIMASLKLEEWS